MTQYLDLEGLKKFKEKADELYKPIKGTIPLTGSINLTKETVLSLGAKYALIANNTINFYVIADSNGKLPSDETRINVNSDITSLVGAEGANVGDIFVIGKLDLKPVYKIIPLNDAKAANADFKGTQGVVTPWDKTQINKVPNLESALNSAKNNLPTRTESNMNNALQTGFYPWCTLGRPAGSTGAYTLVTLASSTADSAGYTTIEQTAYGRQDDELGKIFKRIIFKKDGDVQFGEWKEITGGGSDGYLTYSPSYISVIQQSNFSNHDDIVIGCIIPKNSKIIDIKGYVNLTLDSLSGGGNDFILSDFDYKTAIKRIRDEGSVYDYLYINLGNKIKEVSEDDYAITEHYFICSYERDPISGKLNAIGKIFINYE